MLLSWLRLKIGRVIFRWFVEAPALRFARLFRGREFARELALMNASYAHKDLEAGQWGLAAFMARLSIAFDPRQPWGYGMLASAYFRSGNLVKARITYQRGAEAVPRDPLLPAYLGHMEFELGNFAEAEKAYRHALDLNPDDTSPYPWLAIAVRRQKRWKDAINLLKHARELDPQNVELLVELGVAQMNLSPTSAVVASYEFSTSF